MNLEFLKLYLMSLVGIRYYYGGQHPLRGYDCSGLVVEALQAMGELQHGIDMGSQALYNHYSAHGKVGEYGIGALVFFGKDVCSITHVGICLDEELMIEAGGGDKGTVSEEDAVKRGAFVRMRPIQYRKDFFAVIRPYYTRKKRLP